MLARLYDPLLCRLFGHHFRVLARRRAADGAISIVDRRCLRSSRSGGFCNARHPVDQALSDPASRVR